MYCKLLQSIFMQIRHQYHISAIQSCRHVAYDDASERARLLTSHTHTHVVSSTFLSASLKLWSTLMFWSLRRFTSASFSCTCFCCRLVKRSRPWFSFFSSVSRFRVIAATKPHVVSLTDEPHTQLVCTTECAERSQ